MTKSKKFKKLVRNRARLAGQSYCAARNVLLGRHKRSLGHRAEVIAIAGMKGGIGRSTLAILMASEMHLRGERVLLVGLRPAQCPFGESIDFLNTVQHWKMRAELSGFVGPSSITIRDQMLVSLEFAELVSGYSLVIVDCPRILEVQYAAMTWADTVLIPCSTAPMVASAMDDALGLVALGRRQNHSLASKVVVAMEHPRSSPRRIAALREAASECGIEISKAILRERVAFMECLDAGRPLSEYAFGGKALDEFQSLLNEVFPTGRPGRREMWASADMLSRMKPLSEEDFVGRMDKRRFYRTYAARAEPSWIVPL